MLEASIVMNYFVSGATKYNDLNFKPFNPNLVTLKKLVILLPGAFFGTFIINQFTWSLFWQFWYLIMHWFIFKKLVILLPGAFFGTFKKNQKNFFLQNINLHIEKIKVKFSQNFWLMISTLKKIKEIHKDRKGSR